MAFPALSLRKYLHNEIKRMLRSVIPFPIKETWTHDFCCIPGKNQVTTPSSDQMDRLKKAGLSRKKIVFEDKDTKHDRFCEIIIENFPQ